MRRHPRSVALVLAAGVAAVALGVTVSARGRGETATLPQASWLGLVGGARGATPSGQRMIVVLRTPSVAQRLAKVRYATEAQERAWSTQAVAAQKEALLSLAAHGLQIRPDYSFTRVLDGFSAALDLRAVPLLENDPEVLGVYPVRAAFPASDSETELSSKAFASGSGHRPEAELPGVDGRGVTIALLDTGVDFNQPYLRGRLLPGFDVVDGGDDAAARTDPSDKTAIERHGTEMAGILAGSDGPGGLHGVAPEATILPIRVAGWQPASSGRQLVFSRSDQLIAGLERAVDPNGDGDCHDAVRVALIGVAEPYAAFTDAPEAQAVAGALNLDTMVVTPAGNDGVAGPRFGSVAGPAAATGALAVGATDTRTDLPRARVVLRRGLDVIFDQDVPVLGTTGSSRSLTLALAPADARGVASAFDTKGFNRVAGRAIVAAATAPEAQAEAAAHAGAAALVLYGDALPAGSLRVSDSGSLPVVVVPAAPALELLAAQRAGLDVGVAIGPAHDEANADRGYVADFSSRGLAFDGSVKPNLAAPGVAIATSEPGTAPDGSPVYGTVNGTSAAAATVAGGAALLAQLRPDLDGPALQSLLVGYAQPGGASPMEAGAGTFRLGASAVGEVSAQPASLGFGIWEGPRWHATRTVVVRNVSSRRLQLSISVVSSAESEALGFKVTPDHLELGIGKAARVQVRVVAPTAPGPETVTGVLRIAPAASEALRVPWALSFSRPLTNLLGSVSLSKRSFKQSDTQPAVLTIQAGNIAREQGVVQVEPVARLDVLLYTAGGRYIGLLARLRDLLPGTYSFGLTGRGPTSAPLPPGGYELRLAAWPTLPNDAQPSRAKVRFRVG